MKKIFVSLLATSTALLLAGCSNNSDSQALTTLNNQLSRVDEIVSSTSSSEVSEVSPTIIYDNTTTQNSIQNHRAYSYSNMTREEKIRQNILALNGYLKNCTQNEIKLGKQKASAIQSLSSNISKYVTDLNGTKAEVKASVNKIKKNLNNVTKINIDEAESAYISLHNSMNERYAYLCNIYDNLEQACILICGSCDYCNNYDNCENCNDISSQNTYNSNSNNNYAQTNSNNNNNNYNDYNNNSIISENNNKSQDKKFKKNIDSYAPTNDNSNINNINQQSYNYQTAPYNYYDNNTLNNNYGYNVNGFNGYNGYNGYGYGYNNGYYGYNARNRFNPNRNTDTFYAYGRNIDTYRYNPNYNYNYYNNLNNNVEKYENTLSTNQQNNDSVTSNQEKFDITKNLETINNTNKNKTNDITENANPNKNNEIKNSDIVKDAQGINKQNTLMNSNIKEKEEPNKELKQIHRFIENATKKDAFIF